MERVQTGADKTPKATGRKGTDKVAAVQDLTKLRDDLPRLKKLLLAKQEATEDYNNAVVKTAEKSGFLSNVVNKAVTAYAGDDFEEKHRQVQQLALVFDEVAKA